MYRRKLTISRVKNIFKFVSQKMSSVYLVESFLEFDACFHFEYSPNVVSFETQPLGFKYYFEGKQCPYTPDVLVNDLKNGERFVEIKPVTKTINGEFRSRFKAKQQQALNLGKPLILVTEQQIRVNPILNNLKLLHRYSGFQSFTPLQFELIALVKRIGRVPITKLLQANKVSVGGILASVLGLISHGFMSTDLVTGDFGLNSKVWLSNGQ